MKKQNRRNTIIGAVIGGAIVAAVALLALWRTGWFPRTPDPVPNADFGSVEAVYRPMGAVEITDLEGDTDVVSIDYILPNYSDGVYYEFAPALERRNWDMHGDYRKYKDGSDALTLHLLATVHADTQLVQTSLSPLPTTLGEMKAEPYHAGMIEKLDENGEWVAVSPLECKDVADSSETAEMFGVFVDVTDSSQTAELFGVFVYDTGINHIALNFPLHEPGTYRLTYNFRAFEENHEIGDEVYTVSHTLTIPEQTGKKFDLVSVDLYTTEDDNLRVAAIIRSNDGTIPLQNLLNTRLEKLVGGEWADASDALTELYDVSGGGYDIYSAVSYDGALHPFTGEAVDNLFCGIAGFERTDDTERYRLTLEFADGRKRSDARYALQLTLDFN